MNVEQRLMEAFLHADRVEPSPDLWSRVVHSIDEDRAHRRRVVGTTSGCVVATLLLVGVGAASVESGRVGRFVHRPTMEVLEALALVTLVVVLGPAIRRFGRGYANDLWPAGAATPHLLLRLLDLAYYLVGAGYVLLSTELEFANSGPRHVLADQLADAAARVGGLLLVLAVLHASTFATLPMVALVDNSTRTGRPVPKWVLLLLVLVGVAAVPLVPPLIGLGLAEW